MKIISLFNQKGGVGKSTTVSSLMYYFTSKGKKVLGVDVDGQGHLTKLCGINTNDENTVLELLQKKATFVETVKHSKFGDLLPADRQLQFATLQFAQQADFMFSILDMLEGQNYDYVFIDCPPAVNIITTAVLVASDYVIIPTEVEYLSLDGVQEMAQTIRSAKNRLNPKLEVMGLLLVKYNTRRKLTRALEEHLERTGRELFGAQPLPMRIRNTVDVPSAQARQMSVFEYKPKSEVTKEYTALAEYIERRVQENVKE